jgi:hypothetical protein
MSWWHTPGPWKVIDTYNEMPVGCDGFVIESVDGLHIIPDGKQRLGCEKADARLIAAAPELLAALQVLFDEADSFSIDGVYFNEKCMGQKGLDMARAAIAKSTGGAP